MANQRVIDSQTDGLHPNAKPTDWDPTVFFTNKMNKVTLIRY